MPNNLTSAAGPSSLEKALEICEALAGASRGATVTELGRALALPAPTVHRLLGVLKRRGYVRQDEETTKYSLTLKMLDLSFRLLGRSELRLHAYPVLREFALRTGLRSFIAVPSAGEVTYVWKAGPDEVSMHTTYTREMPGHCKIYFEPKGTRRLSCVRLPHPRAAADPERVLLRFGPPSPTPSAQRLLCTCAPVYDYSAREVARVGVFAHGTDERPFCGDRVPAGTELARLISLRLGHLPAGMAASA
ncbi:MAG TPA: helix-turn-helix domain-containing protein [Vicinamibacterales bacterium]|nr:helix-turn-helix domain-containing protein [Vicinamibacterales bacterium]